MYTYNASTSSCVYPYLTLSAERLLQKIIYYYCLHYVTLNLSSGFCLVLWCLHGVLLFYLSLCINLYNDAEVVGLQRKNFRRKKHCPTSGLEIGSNLNVISRKMWIKSYQDKDEIQWKSIDTCILLIFSQNYWKFSHAMLRKHSYITGADNNKSSKTIVNILEFVSLER